MSGDPSIKWAVSQPDFALVRLLTDELGISEVTARVLAARGIGSADEARAFLAPSLDRDWPGTSAIPGLAEVAARVSRAIDAGEHIVVFGDFDLDGISAAAVATRGLRALGADVDAVVPHRFREGYGLTPAAVERLVGMSPRLVVTVDCGISSAKEVETLKERGIDVVVTDHHEPGEDVPAAIPVADPRLARQGPDLAGAGVSLALVRAVGEARGIQDVWRQLTDLAALGTIADVVPLTGANRALVADGLAAMRAHPRAGIAALADAAGIATDAITAGRVAFALAPRLNAAGRMADPALSLELLLTSDAVRAEELARALDEHNRLRQAAESDLMEEAIAQAEKTYCTGDAALVVAGEGWHEGVRGIVASRLVERYGVPSIVFCVEEGVAQGSGRSVPGVDLYRALESVSARLLRFGGHPQAVGLALPADDLPWFRAALLDRLSQETAGLPAPVLAIDAEVELSDLGVELAAELDTLEPFGHENPRPLLATRGVFLNGRRAVGKTGTHLAFTAYDGVASVPGIMFRCMRIDDLLSYEATADVAFEFDVDEWQGSARPRLVARDIVTHTAPPQAPASQLVHDLFEHAEEIVAQGEYANIGEEESFHTKLVGVTFEGRQDVIARLETGTPLRLVRERENEHDPNACALHDPRGARVGFFNRRLAAVIAPLIEQGVEYDVTVANVTQSPDEGTLGVNVLVTRRDLAGDRTCVELARDRRAELSKLDGSALDGALREHLLGEHAPHPAQAEALESLAAGTSTLVVMATGRGKSYIFHHHAARLAIAGDRASVFVYPLRALVADQAFHLQDTFAGIGCTVKTVTGETSAPERDEAFSALAEGTLDVVLTTPEFLEHHAARFASAGRISFVVVDEAHHVGLSRAAHRPTYGRLGRALETLGHPVVLAATATADTAVEAQIREVLRIGRTVVDPTVRENLVLDDRRGTRDKDAFVASVVARGDKTIVYVNSRQRAVSLARVLHERVAATHDAVAFYTAGLSRTARHAIEAAFREGAIKTVVATSAFGEGVNVPDVRHVILYHMPFSAVEFNQMSGRAGRDGGLAKVHLLYGEADARINRSILKSLAPERDDIAAVYLALKECATESGGSVEVTNSELAERLKKFRPKSSLDEKGVSVAIGILRELGLLDAEGTGSWRRLSLLPAPEVKLDLATSVRYAEGHEEVALFEEFTQWALTASADDLLHTFDRPILPRHPSA